MPVALHAQHLGCAAPVSCQQHRPASKVHRPCSLLQHDPALPLRRSRQPLVCSADGRHFISRTRQRLSASRPEDGSPVVDVTPMHRVDVEAVSSAPQQQWTQRSWLELGQRIARGALALALAAALALAPFGGDAAWAARSGGRVGGSSFSAARSSGSSFGRSSYGGAIGGGGYSYGRPSVAPSVTVMPRTSFGFWGYPTYPYGGYGYGGGGAVVSGGGGFGGLGTLLLLGVLGYAALQILPALTGGTDESGYGKCTVAKLQIGLTGTAVGLKKELERIAKRADTNTPEGLNFVLQETVLSLLRHPEYCIYGAANTKGVRGLDAAEERFNEASMRERGKFQEETLMNVSGRTRNAPGGRFAGSRGPTGDELIVVTVLVAADGDVKLPAVTSQEQLRTALNRLGSLRSDQVLAVEVLWTPQDEGDYFTRDDLAVDYPKLNTL